MTKKAIFSDKAPAPIGPYSQGVQIGNMLFLSGQIALDPETNERYRDNLEAETRGVMNNIQNLLTEAGYTFDDVVKASIFLKDMDNFAEVNNVYSSFLQQPYPARETVEVSQLPKNVNVEISVIAVKM